MRTYQSILIAALAAACMIALVPGAVLWASSAGTSQSSNASNDIVAYWSFDEGPWGGNSTLQDASPCGNYGSTFSNTNVAAVPGVHGKAAYFDGTNGLMVPDSDSLDVPTGFTIEVWVNVTSFWGNGVNCGNVIVCKWMTNPIGQYILTTYTGGHIIFKVANGTDNNTIKAKDILKSGKWYFLQASWNATQMALYVDGQLLQKINSTVKTLDQRDNEKDFVEIGYNNWGWPPFWYFNGSIDELKIYNRSLEASEILEHYNGTDEPDDNDTNPNTAPVITTWDKTKAVEGSLYSTTYYAYDVQTPYSELSWTLETNASWLSFYGTTLSGKPKSSDVGTSWANISVSDGELSDHSNFTISVSAVSNPNQSQPMALSFEIGEDTSGRITPSDIGADMFGIESVVGGEKVSVVLRDGELILTPIGDWSGTQSVTVDVITSNGLQRIELDLTVTPVNDPPKDVRIADLERAYSELDTIQLSALGTDPDEDKLTYSWEIDGNRYSGSSLSLNLPPGHYFVILTATDPQGLSATTEGYFDVVGEPSVPDPVKHDPFNWIPILIMAASSIAIAMVATMAVLVSRRKKPGMVTPVPESINETWDANSVRTGSLDDGAELVREGSGVDNIISRMMVEEPSRNRLESGMLREQAKASAKTGRISRHTYKTIETILEQAEE